MTSPYFNNYKAVNEQSLVENLVIESIHQWGIDVNYLPREGNNPDIIFNEDDSAEYNSNYSLEVYLKSFDGYEGNGEFLAKFGIEVRHQCVLTVAIRTFKQQVGNTIKSKRPLEGDLIYFKMDNKLFVIKDVKRYDTFYQAGTLQSYDMICEVFEYAGEQLNTGIAAIDQVEKQLSLSTLQNALLDNNGHPVLDANGKPQFDPSFNLDKAMKDYGADNEEIATESGGLIDATDDNIMSEKF